MTQTSVLERIAPICEASLDAAGAEYVLNVLVVYEDPPTRQWAREVCDRVGKLVGKESVRSTWWKLSELSNPAVLAGAVSRAMRADVIVVAMRAAEGLPLAFYIWVDSWLPHRPHGLGALVALVGLPERPSSQMDRVRDYLRAVARKGHLDFLIEERKLSAESIAVSESNEGLKMPPVGCKLVL